MVKGGINYLFKEEFKESELNDIFQETSVNLTEEINIYVFGGAVMVFLKLKPSTKDIDILFGTSKDYNIFILTIKQSEFITSEIPLEYSNFNMSSMYKNLKTGWRLDLFLGKVCNKFSFSKEVQFRSKLKMEFNKLKVYFISLEDIFIMKALTNRERDLDDMNQILGFGLNFEIVNGEINNQEDKFQIIERIIYFENQYNLKLNLSKKHRRDYNLFVNKENFKLLKLQVQKMLNEDYSKKKVIEYFELSNSEQKRLNM